MPCNRGDHGNDEEEDERLWSDDFVSYNKGNDGDTEVDESSNRHSHLLTKEMNGNDEDSGHEVMRTITIMKRRNILLTRKNNYLLSLLWLLQN